MIKKRLLDGLKNYFSEKKNNRLSLLDDDQLDHNLKSVKVGDKVTPLALSKDEVSIIANYLYLNGYVKLNGSTLEIGGQTSSATLKSPALTIESAGDVTVDSDGDLTLNVDGQDIFFKYLGITLFKWNAVSGMTLYSAADQDDYCQLLPGLNGALTIGTVDDSGNDGANLTLSLQGVMNCSNNSVGFARNTVTFNASDTDVNYKIGNKSYLTLTGNITDLNLKFPGVSANFVLVLKQDGTGNRTITNWKTFDKNDSNESTVDWPSGTAPTLSTGGDAIDIITFYWDSNTNKAYGVASLNFS